MSVVALSHFGSGAVGERADYFCGEDATATDEREGSGLGSGGSEDYYVGAVDDLGGSAWIGGGAEALGLSGRGMTKADFSAVFSGCDPETGERLRQGTAKDNERAGYEMALNVDKSLSALYAIVDSDAKRDIEQAILTAHDKTFDYLCSHGFFNTRRGKGGHIKEPTGNVVAARFLHGTSRNKDPHLHVHCEIASIVQNETGGWTTLDASELYKRQSEARYLFDIALAENLKTLGLSISENDSGVTVRGINEDLLKEWSSRRREIVEELESIGLSGYGNREANMKVTISGRASKDEALNRDDLYRVWHSRAKDYGYSEDFIDSQKALGDDLSTSIKLEEVEADLLKNRSVFNSRDFDRVAARLTVGRGSFETVADTRRDLVNSLDVVRLKGDFYTTRKMVECETAVMRSAIGRQDEQFHRLDLAQVNGVLADRFPTLRDEQYRAVVHLTADSGGLAVMEGAAGTGKSFTLKAVRELYEENGFKVRGLAPSGKAAAELQDGSGIQSQTAHSLLLGLEEGKETLTEKAVLVLDEAGMVDSMTLARLTDYAHEAGAKLILSGDSRQLEAVGTANLLRDVGTEIGSAELIQIARQKDPARKAISQQFFEAQGKSAITGMEAQGLIRQADSVADQMREAVDLYLTNSEARPASESLLLADGRDQVNRLNDLVRQSLMERGILDKEQAVKVSLTDDSDREHDEYLMPGDRIMFRQNNREMAVTNGTTGTVEMVDPARLVVRLDDEAGTLKTVDLTEYNRLDLAFAMTVHKSQGMTVDKAVYVTSDRTDNRAAYVAYTRARSGAEFVTTHGPEELEKACSRQTEKTSVIGAYRDEDTGANPMLEALRDQAAASAQIATMENNADLVASHRVLDAVYRDGVKDDLEGVYSGPELALSSAQKSSFEAWIQKHVQPQRSSEEVQPEPQSATTTALEKQYEEIQIIEEDQREDDGLGGPSL